MSVFGEDIYSQRGYITDDEGSLDGFAVRLIRYEDNEFNVDVSFTDGRQCVHFGSVVTSPADA